MSRSALIRRPAAHSTWLRPTLPSRLSNRKPCRCMAWRWAPRAEVFAGLGQPRTEITAKP